MVAIETQDLWRIYRTETGQDVPALRGITFNIGAGKFIALKGRSGSGKTTLLNCIGGLDKPTKGQVTVFGEKLSELDDKQISKWRREKIGFIFQSFGLMPTLSAYENVELIPRMAKLKSKERRERTIEMLEIVGLKKWIHHRPFEMSGGQQQRVAIARALVNKPKLLIADEPTGELDTETAKDIFGLFREISERENLTLLIATHDSLVDQYADASLELEDGQILSDTILDAPPALIR